MATHNLLLALGPTVYLEVISRDPRAAPVRDHGGLVSTMFSQVLLRDWLPGSREQMTLQERQFLSLAM
jgi:hypothetical protein